MNHPYTCENCGGEFDSGLSEADALMEYQRVFTEEERCRDDELPVLVCDDCYQAMFAEAYITQTNNARRTRI